MSQAVTTTGILVKRRPSPLPATIAITTSAIGTPGLITTAPHLISDKSVVIIAGHTGSTPAIAGTYIARVLSPTTLTLQSLAGVDLNVTVGGSGGTLQADLITIAEITKVGPPGFSRNKIPTSTHNEGVESNNLGMLLQKDPTFTVNYLGNDLTHMAIQADIVANRRAGWQIALPSGITYTADARVQQFMLGDAPLDAIQSADVALTWAEPVVTYVPA